MKKKKSMSMDVQFFGRKTSLLNLVEFYNGENILPIKNLVYLEALREYIFDLN